MISETVVELSRAQFALNAVHYCLFVPLTVGLSLCLLAMESWFLISGQALYQQMSQFWGRIFLIALALTIASSLAMACQFGGNWSYFSHYVGDVFALPLLLGFFGLFLAANATGWFFLGGQGLGKLPRLGVTGLIAGGCHLSLLGFLLASGWMQNPLGAEFNAQTMRIELLDIQLVLSNSLSWQKFVHALLAGYATAAGLILAISAFYVLKQRETELARASYRLAAALGVLAVATAMVIGDASVYGSGQMQHNKLSAINNLANDSALEPTRERIGNGIRAYGLLQELRDEKTEPELLAGFAAAKVDLGYALLLKRWREGVTDATPAQIEQAARASLPPSAPIVWGYRLMITVGTLLLVVFLLANLASFQAWRQTWIVKASLYALPLPWVASASGWFISEFGRQPWLVADILPTWQGVSTLTTTDLIVSLTAYAAGCVGLTVLAGQFVLKFIGQASELAVLKQESNDVA